MKQQSTRVSRAVTARGHDRLPDSAVNLAVGSGADSVRVIALGASAGGLEAFTQVLSGLPADAGLAYVLVQHLDPAHESILAELLARATRMPVLQATDGMQVQPDHVYVIPPGAVMTLAKGYLQLAARARTRGPARSIDAFFRSAADAFGSDAVGVVLSGTGTDGALGLKAIKAAGGITFAQDSESARHAGMPRAAAVTGCADFILSPIAIASRLARIGRAPSLARREAAPVLPDEDRLSPILTLVRERTGVDFTQYKVGTIERRIMRRMVLRAVHAITDYVDMLRADPTEVDALYGDLLIGITRFFREPDLFTALAQNVFPEMLKRRAPEATIRIWVPGCATGQEAYSVAIGLVEALGNAPTATPIQVFATDLSSAAIAIARAGLYPHTIEADVSPERLRQFFVKEPHGYRVARAIRELCLFAPQNIASDPPFSQLDLISCRNVLIYLQPALHDRIFALFHYALKPGGFLVLGGSESIGVATALFTAVDKKQRVFARRPTLGRPPFLDFPRSQERITPTVLPTTSAGHRRPINEVQRAADQIVLGSYSPSGVVIDDELQIVQFRGPTRSYLEPASGTASFDLLGMVREELRTELRDAIRNARGHGGIIRKEGIPVHDDRILRHVDLEVIPFKLLSSDAQMFVVVFEDVDRATATRRRARQRRVRRRGQEKHDGLRSPNDTSGELRQQLDAAKRRLEEIAEEHGIAIGELQAANEEVQSTNEELQSTNEEMETAKEEVQSANQELLTLNDELGARNSELGLLNDDLTNLLTSMHVPAVIVGTDLRIRRFTAGAERLMEIAQGDVGRRIADLTVDVAAPELQRLIPEVVETLVAQEREVRGSDGRWYSMAVRPYRTSEHTIGGAVVVYQDIDERKRNAERIEQARHFADAIVETVREALLVLDGEFRVQRANRAFYEMFRTTVAETEGRLLFDLCDGQWDMPRMRTLKESVAPNEVLFTEIEIALTLPVIGQRAMLLNGRRINFEDGRAPLILLAIEDISVRRDFERREHFLANAAAVFATSAGYDATIEAIGAIAVPTFAEWCIVDVTEPDGTVRRAEVVYHEANPDGLAGPRTRPAVITPEQPVANVLRTGESFLLQEIPASYLDSGAWDRAELARIRALDPQSLLIVPLRSGTHILGAITMASTRAGAVRSYTQEDLAVAEEFARRAALAIEAAAHYRDMATARMTAEAANRVKSDFLATMSHELRTPLNAILGYVQLLELEINGPVTDAQREYLRRIEYSQQHLLGLIEDVLQFAKIEAGHVDLNLTAVPVDAVLTEAAALATPQMRRKELRYTYSPSDAGVLLRGDRARVRQIVLNLLANAMKFTNAGGQITLECIANTLDVIVRVTDTGIGIPPEKMELIFEPFVQLDSALTRKADGTGLGLAISRSFARQMAGDLTATSVVGQGSAFSLHLPRAFPPSQGPFPLPKDPDRSRP